MTVMWPTQRLNNAQENEAEIAQCVSEILELASDTVSRHHLEHGFIIFPLFIAGCAATSTADQALARDLIHRMEQESIGKNTRATRKLLEAVYERQNARLASTGRSTDVDWIQVMLESGLQVVSYGL